MSIALTFLRPTSQLKQIQDEVIAAVLTEGDI